MVERQEVEALLAAVDCGDPWWFTKTEMVVIAALCRAWLAAEDAPVGRLDIVQDDFDGSEMVEIVMDPNHVSHLLHQRVRIVREPVE